MTAERSNRVRIVTAAEVANYIVCPEAWRLKYIAGERNRAVEPNAVGQKIRAAWAEKQDLSARLRFYALLAYGLLVIFVIGAFLFEQAIERRALRERPVAPRGGSQE